jgi:transposase
LNGHVRYLELLSERRDPAGGRESVCQLAEARLEVVVAWEPWRLSERLWVRVAPLLPVVERRLCNPGRRRIDDRRCVEGILFVLFSGLPWDAVPAELDVSGVTCWRRLQEWQQAGVWERLLELLLVELEQAGLVDEQRYIVDASIVPAKKGAPRRGAARWIVAAPRASGI